MVLIVTLVFNVGLGMIHSEKWKGKKKNPRNQRRKLGTNDVGDNAIRWDNVFPRAGTSANSSKRMRRRDSNGRGRKGAEKDQDSLYITLGITASPNGIHGYRWSTVCDRDV